MEKDDDDEDETEVNKKLTSESSQENQSASQNTSNTASNSASDNPKKDLKSDSSNPEAPKSNADKIRTVAAKLPKPSFRLLPDYDEESIDAPPRSSAYYRYIEKPSEELEEEVITSMLLKLFMRKIDCKFNTFNCKFRLQISRAKCQ